MRLSIIAPLTAAVVLAASAIAAPGQKKKPAGAKPSAATLAEGKKRYTAAGCAACHIIDGKGGKTGPDLSHIGKTWSAEKIFQQNRNPKKFKADGVMPAVGTTGPTGLTDAQLKAVAAYLASKK